MNQINISTPSVASLFLEIYFNNIKLASATGFIINTKQNSYLITNRHNFTGKDNLTGECLSKTLATPNRVVIWHNKKQQLGTWIPKSQPLIENDSPKWHEHPSLKEKADFVALPLTELDDIELYPYELKNEESGLNLKPTDILRVVGFPFGLSSSGGGYLAVWVTGFVASEPQVPYLGLPTFLIDCKTRSGQSGSPVLFHINEGSAYHAHNETKILTKGSITEFLGIYSGRIHKDSDIGIVWKKSAIEELIKSIS
jgi:hypothetical protein